MRTLVALSVVFLMAACSEEGKPEQDTSARPTEAELEATLRHQNQLAERNDKKQQKFLASLPSMTIERVYYVDPYDPMPGKSRKDRVQGYRILDRAESTLPEKATAALRDSLQRIIVSTPTMLAACFDPHHVVSLSDGTDRYDAVVCFDCGNFRILTADGEVLISDGFEDDEEAVWDKTFAEAGLRRPAEPQPR